MSMQSIAVLAAAAVLLSGCLATAVAGAAVGVTAKAAGATARGAGAVVGAVIPGGKKDDGKPGG
jgi:hypothetical protein